MAATLPTSYPSMGASGYHKAAAVDLEAALDHGSFAAASDAMRLGFVRKVFGLLSAQLLVTVIVATPIVASGPRFAASGAGSALLMLALLASLGLLLTLTFSERARHSHPTNLLLLGAFTVAEGVVVGAVTSQYQLSAILLAVCATAAITAGLTVYALTTKRDFTLQGGLLFSLLFGLLLTGLLASFAAAPLAHVVLAGGGALLFAAYIVYDVQLLAGGKHTAAQVSTDEYVLGAITVYLDVVNLFLHLLRIIAELTRER